MSQSWQELKISQADVEQVFEPTLICSWAIALATGLMLRQSQSWQSILKIESLCLFISLIFNFPLVLIASRNLELISNNIQGFMISLAIAFSLSSLYLVTLNYYLWQKAKQLKLLSSLLIKVKKYNRLIASFQLLTDINYLSNRSKNNSVANTQSLTELKTALNLTRANLLRSIELESYLYFHQDTHAASTTPYNPAQLLADLENNLAATVSPETESDLEYQQLYDEAIDLGVSLHQEIHKFWIQRQGN
ncbi:MAG: hypothetical protein AAF298_02605 [Cyanobacteria bacterium P01_A01_bin.40]